MVGFYEFLLFLIPKPNSHWSKFLTLGKSDLKRRFSKESKSATNGTPKFCFFIGMGDEEGDPKVKPNFMKGIETISLKLKIFYVLRVIPPLNHL